MRDRFIIRLITAFAILCIVNTNAFCFYVDSLVAFDYVSLTQDLIVTNAGNFNANATYVDESVLISNRGVINSDFYVAASQCVYVKNSGIINGDFYLAPDAHLTQIIESVDDITDIYADTNFTILVHNAENVPLTDVLNIAGPGNRIILKNSTLVLNDAPITKRNISNQDIEIIGNVILKLNTTDSLNYSIPVLHNVSGAGSVRFDIPDMDPLYKAVGAIDNGNLYMEIVRETDYARVLKNDVGNFLNNLRRSYPNDKLLTVLDSASSMDSLNYVTSRSVRLRPIKLMEPVQRMNLFDMLDAWRYADAAGVYSYADVVFSDSDFGYRANVAVVDNVANNLYAAITGYIGATDVSDNINDFGAYTYGANVATHYDDGAIIGNLLIGGNYTSFDVGPVLDGAKVVNNPNGISGYGALDIGMYVVRNKSVSVAPFVGMLANYVSVLDDSDISALANLSAEINWSQYEFDILYDYGIRGGVLTDDAFYANMYAKFTAPFDDVGAEIDFGFIHDDNGMNYKISISAHLLF